MTAQALQISDVALVKVTVTGAELPSPLVIPLVRTGTQFSALASDIPVGTDYSFTASATDNSTPPVEIYHGSVTQQVIQKNSTANIVINMNQVAAVAPLSKEAPWIDALTASSLLAGYGDSISLKALAHDPDAGQTAQLTFAWSATCGSVSGNVVTAGNETTPSVANAVFTAPSADSACVVTLTVTDPTGLGNTASFAITVADANATGNGKITAYLDTYPVIASLNANPAQLVPGATTSLTVLASDPDGDALTYAWSTPCPGAFSSADASTTTFTLATAATNTSCDFTVVVTDGNFPDGHAKGGVITNDLVLAVKPVAVKGAPVITLDYQTWDSFVAGSVVGMAVAANNLAGGTLTYEWTTTFGPAPTLTTPAALGLNPSPWTSAATFSSPTQPAVHTVVMVTVTATSSMTGQSASETFVLTAGVPCQCDGNGPGNVPVTVACGQTTCGADYNIYSCSASGWTLTSQSCTAPAPPPPCTCTGAGPGNVPLTVACGESACGTDYTIYACSVSGFAPTGQSCASDACACSGAGPGNDPITVACGQSACGTDYTIYACSASGFTATGQSCALPPPPCTCTGAAPGGASITVACGLSTCGSDYNMYACSTSGWTTTGYTCTVQAPPPPSCQCSGGGPGGVPVTVACGQTTCGSDYTLYACGASGFTATSQSCAPAAPPCMCNGTGPGGSAVTVACGQSTCGSDYKIYACSASGFTSTGASCAADACSCNGTGAGSFAITVACGGSACGADYQVYACSASGFTATGQSCAPPPPPCTCTGAAPGGASITVACGQSSCGSDYVIYACSASGWAATSQSCAP